MRAAPGLRRPPVPLLPALAWIVLSVVRIGDVAVLVVALLVIGLVELVSFVRSVADEHPQVRQPALAAGALMGLTLGAELGFGFGGGPGLALVAATAYLGARAAFVAAVIAWSASAGARRPLFAWRRVQVLGLAVSLVFWLVLLAGDGVVDPAAEAVNVHGIRFDLPGGVGLLLALVAASLVGEGILQFQAHRATEAWVAGRGGRRAAAFVAPTPGPDDDGLDGVGYDVVLDQAGDDPAAHATGPMPHVSVHVEPVDDER